MKFNADFIGRLTDSVEKQVRGDSTRKLLLKLLAFNNAHEDCQAGSQPIRKTQVFLGYLKAYSNIRTLKHLKLFLFFFSFFS